MGSVQSFGDDAPEATAGVDDEPEDPAAVGADDDEDVDDEPADDESREDESREDEPEPEPLLSADRESVR